MLAGKFDRLLDLFAVDTPIRDLLDHKLLNRDRWCVPSITHGSGAVGLPGTLVVEVLRFVTSGTPCRGHHRTTTSTSQQSLKQEHMFDLTATVSTDLPVLGEDFLNAIEKWLIDDCLVLPVELLTSKHQFPKVDLVREHPQYGVLVVRPAATELAPFRSVRRPSDTEGSQMLSHLAS